MCLCTRKEPKTILEIPKELNLYKEKTHITVDTCMVSEIKYLWSKGIGTYGCCCGHNEQLPFINIRETDLDKVKELGYVVQTNFNGEENIKRVDTVYPKTIDITLKMVEHMFSHIREYMRFKKSQDIFEISHQMQDDWNNNRNIAFSLEYDSIFYDKGDEKMKTLKDDIIEVLKNSNEDELTDLLYEDFSQTFKALKELIIDGEHLRTQKPTPVKPVMLYDDKKKQEKYDSGLSVEDAIKNSSIIIDTLKGRKDEL